MFCYFYCLGTVLRVFHLHQLAKIAHQRHQCEKIQFQDVRRFNQKFYSTPGRLAQNNFVLHYITVETLKRKRPRVQILEDGFTLKKVVTTKYFMPNLEHGTDGSEISITAPVCKNLFIKNLCISRYRV